ncbi:hypothetical protein C5Z25_07045 [Lactobacillus sp. CBA3605]|uniref:hypothetical protein n=1 Tax=Lactobacillus sp. CBA3605 TaxID=2099788 RepID=UPI000CFDA800|nr:hypothetical protein [Lactobacillus sp. CBA3605]AVK61539.1 hypothetical protein C5Z25_07045 [Lactobacillus sp. CBA3605]
MIQRTLITRLFMLILWISLLIGIISNIIEPLNLSLSLIVMAVVILGLTGLPWLNRCVNHLTNRQMKFLIWIGFVVIVIIQVLRLQFFPVTIYHDPFRLLAQAEVLCTGSHNWGISTYFWRYPNNVPLVVGMTAWLKLMSIFHLSTNWALQVLSLLFLDGFIIIILKLIQQQGRRNGYTLATLLFFVISPFAYTYYLQVFYSDMPSLFLLASLVAILMSWPTLTGIKKGLAGLGLFLTTLVGQLIKPNLIVLLVAIIVVIGMLASYDLRLLVKWWLPWLIIGMGFIATVPTKSGLMQVVQFETKSRYELPTSSWILMGFNAKSAGSYSSTDVDKLNQLKTKQARQAYIKRELPKRLETLGIKGILMQWLTKLVKLLNVSSIQQAYTGGYQVAPTFYQRYGVFFSTLGSLIFRVYWILLAIMVIKRSRLLSKLARIPVCFELIVILILGYLAFHTLLWEAESRYGQIIFPLLLALNSFAIPVVGPPQRQQAKKTWLRGLRIVLLLMILGIAISWDIMDSRNRRLWLRSEVNCQPSMVQLKRRLSQGQRLPK